MGGRRGDGRCDVADNLNERVKPSFIRDERVFQPYDADQLREILKNRRGAFKDGVLSNDEIPLVAAFAAQEFDILSQRRVQVVLKEQNFLTVTQLDMKSLGRGEGVAAYSRLVEDTDIVRELLLRDSRVDELTQDDVSVARFSIQVLGSSLAHCAVPSALSWRSVADDSGTVTLPPSTRRASSPFVSRSVYPRSRSVKTRLLSIPFSLSVSSRLTFWSLHVKTPERRNVAAGSP